MDLNVERNKELKSFLSRGARTFERVKGELGIAVLVCVCKDRYRYIDQEGSFGPIVRPLA